MQTSVHGQFIQVNAKLDGLTNEIREEGAEIRTEIVADGERTREAFRQTITGKLAGHPPFRVLVLPTLTMCTRNTRPPMRFGRPI